MTEEAGLVLDVVFFVLTMGLAACIRRQPCGIEQSTMTEDACLVDAPCLILDAVMSKNKELAACIREQPCGVEQPTMTDDASLGKGTCPLLDAPFQFLMGKKHRKSKQISKCKQKTC